MAVHPAVAVRGRTRRFFVGIALAIALTVFAGFAPTYYLRAYYDPTPLQMRLHLHGVVFTGWILLLLAQTTLVAARRTDLHRRLGIAGAALALLLVAVGVYTAIAGAREGAGPPGVPPLAFLAVPMMDMVMFAGLAGAGLWYRRRPEAHKRLMILATIAMLAAPIARLPFGAPLVGLPGVFAMADVFIVAVVVYDLVTRGRVHPATAWGGLAIVASQPLRLALSGTGAWLGLAAWLTG